MLFEPKQNYFGLDLSDRSIKAVELKRTLHGNPMVTALATIEVPEGVFDDGTLKDASTFSQILTRLTSKPAYGKFSTAYTVACLPETKTFIKLIDIPPMPPEERSQGVRWEAEHHIPIPIDETYWDWMLVDSSTPVNARLPILLGVVPREIVDSYTAGLTGARLTPLALEIEAVAISRALFRRGPTEPAQGTMVVDLGALRTSLVVVDRGVIQFTVSLPLSGRQLTAAIAEALKLSETEAEEAKCLCGLDQSKAHGAVAQVLQQPLENLVHHISESTVFYREHFPGGNPVSRMVLCGGGANLIQLDRFLADRLGLSVERGDTKVNVQVPLQLATPNLLGYTTAIGLALREMNTAAL